MYLFLEKNIYRRNNGFIDKFCIFEVVVFLIGRLFSLAREPQGFIALQNRQ